MDFFKEYERIMEKDYNIALATSEDNIPNVRIISFGYNPGKKGTIYFTTFRNKNKVEEFEKNDKVAFTTIPTEGIQHIRVKGAVIKESSQTLEDVKEYFLKKMPTYEMWLNIPQDKIALYEINFEEANIILGINQQAKLDF